MEQKQTQGRVCLGLLCVLLLAGIVYCVELCHHTENACCPDGWRKFGCSCYYISTESKTWNDSKQDCLGRVADLVIINSKEEQVFLTEFNKTAWIGLTEIDEEGTWKWTFLFNLHLRVWIGTGGQDSLMIVVRFRGKRECVEIYYGQDDSMDDYINDQVIELNEIIEENENRATRRVKTETHRSVAVTNDVFTSSYMYKSFPDNRSIRDSENKHFFLYKTNVTKGRDQLQTSYNGLTKERDLLQTSYNGLTKERDQLQTSYNGLTKERDQIQRERDNYQKKFDGKENLLF
ncbi:unnamed protein product [Coregonus sp. 'balchen']|nr:unnamed protein product [Coregonus sp. 'balchen']